jgi:ATP-dependent DNA helicase RecQ
MFQPLRFAEQMEMKWEAVNRAIRQLIKLPMVDYIPPFRGRAIHVVDRKKLFSQLDIDFPELARRQQAEYDKLKSVIRFATTRRCRQLEILEYFGDPDRKLCGNCDNCVTRPVAKTGAAANSDRNACLYAAQVALSGTARTHGRIGKNLIAQMLSGSTSKKVKQLGLDRLSTFGLLKKLRQTDVVALMEFLIQQGYIQQIETTKFRPVTSIAPLGRQLMGGELEVDLAEHLPADLVNSISIKLRGKLPRRAKSKPPTDSKPIEKPEASDVSNDVNEQRQSNPQVDPLARDISGSDDHWNSAEEDSFDQEPDATEASAQGDLGEIPNHHFSQPANNKPKAEVDTKDQPPNSALDSGNKGLDSRSQTPLRTKIRVDLPDPKSIQPTFYWTWRLLADGYSIDHLRQVRQLDIATVFDHAIRALENDFPAELDWLLPEEKIASIDRFVAQHPADRPSNLIAKLPPNLAAHELLYFMKCRQLA